MLVPVKLQFPYELSFLSVFWITSKSNQKYMLDVVNEVFSRSGRTKTRRREASWHHLFYGENAFIYGTRNSHITGGPQHDQKRYCRTDKEFKENDPSSTAPKEPCVFSEMKNITLHLCGFSFIYAEIKSNSPLIIIIWIL